MASKSKRRNAFLELVLLFVSHLYLVGALLLHYWIIPFLIFCMYIDILASLFGSRLPYNFFEKFSYRGDKVLVHRDKLGKIEILNTQSCLFNGRDI